MATFENMVRQKLRESSYPKQVNPYLKEVPPKMSSKPAKEEKRVVRVTGYNKTGNPMANGKMPEPGYVATSDRKIPLGSKVILDGKTYTVGDRTAKWVHTDKGDTIDIFYDEPKEKTLKRGAPKKEATIIYK